MSFKKERHNASEEHKWHQDLRLGLPRTRRLYLGRKYLSSILRFRHVNSSIHSGSAFTSFILPFVALQTGFLYRCFSISHPFTEFFSNSNAFFILSVNGHAALPVGFRRQVSPKALF
jgi:hypothetical protein